MAEPSSRLAVVLRRNLWEALRKGAYPEAEEVLSRLKGEEPLSLETRGLELEYLLGTGRLDEAGTLAGQLLEQYPGSARLHWLAGQLAYRRKDYVGAESHLRESLSLHPHWRTRHLLGKALTQAGRLHEAEAVLLALLPEHRECRRDLAWLYERMGDQARALRTLEGFLEARPQDAAARGQRLRLRARLMEPQELLDEVRTLHDLGEEPPAEVLPVWFEALLRTGRGAPARDWLRAHGPALDARTAVRIGWACYKLQAWDLAFELFRAAFAENRRDGKFLSALEFAAARSANVATLLDLYRAHAPEEKRLFGRMKALQRRSGSVP